MWLHPKQNQHSECAPSESSLSAWKKPWVLSYTLSAQQRLIRRACWSESAGRTFILLVLSCCGSNVYLLHSETFYPLKHFIKFYMERQWGGGTVWSLFKCAGRKKTKMVAQPIYDKPLSMASYQNSRWHWNLVCSIWFYQIYSNVGCRLPFNLCQMSVWFLGFFTGKMPSSITQRLLKTIIQKVYMDRVKRFWYL